MTPEATPAPRRTRGPLFAPVHVLLVALLGCASPVEAPTPPAEVDRDGDGFTSELDCDDSDDTVHPDAVETCDGVDQDCNGTVDDDATDERSGFADADGDGFGDPSAPVQGCTLPPSTVADASDCDDTDPRTHPGAYDAPADGIDRDCDGADATTRDCSVEATLSGDLRLEGPVAPGAVHELCADHNAVAGDVILSGTDLVDTTPLSCLCSVTGDVVVEANPSLERLSGAALGVVGGNVEIRDNPSLVEITDWRMGELGGTITLEDNDALTSIEALVVTRVGGSVVVRHNDGLDAFWLYFREVAGDVRVEDNGALEYLHQGALPGSVGGDLRVVRNPGLRAFDGEDDVPWTLGGSLVLADLPALEHAIALDNMQSVGGDLHILRTATPGFISAGVEAIGGALEVRDNARTTGIAFPQLERVGGDVRLEYNPALSTVSGGQPGLTIGGSVDLRENRDAPLDMELFAWLVSIGGDLRVDGQELEGPDPLGRLETIGGDLRLARVRGRIAAPMLHTVEGGIEITAMPPGGAVQLDGLTTLGGDMVWEASHGPADWTMSSLATLGGSILVRDVYPSPLGLQASLPDLPMLLEVPGTVRLQDADGLADLSGLDALTSIGDELFIASCDQLADMGALSGLVHLGRMTVYDNPALSSAQALTIAAGTDVAPQDVYIKDNAP